MVQYVFALSESSSPALNREYIHYQSLAPQDTRVRDAVMLGERALGAKDSPRLRLNLARILIDSGQDARAFSVLAPLSTSALTRPFDYQLLLDNLVSSDSPSNAIGLYERVSEIYRLPALDNLVALAHLKSLQQGNDAKYDMPPDQLVQVLRYRPVDLFANNEMRRLAETRSLRSSAYLTPLERFSSDAILPSIPGFVPYVAKSIPSLLADGLWDIHTTENVVSALVWRYPESDAVEQLLQMLRTRYPGCGAPNASYYLGELYDRRNDWKKAVGFYSIQSGCGDLASTQRLAVICRDQPAVCNVAPEIPLTQFNALVATRWRLVSDACRSEKKNWLSCGLLEEKLRESFAAGSANKTSHAADLDRNLLPNGILIKWKDRENPVDWTIQAMNYGPGQGAFAGGRDVLVALENGGSARLTYFWGRQDYSSIALKYSGDAAVSLQSDHKYLLSVDYKTSEDAGILTVWSSESLPLCNQSGEGEAHAQVELPPTKQLWVRATLKLCVPATSNVSFAPAIRLWSPGTAWVDNVFLREED